jgi:hypothetical protein
MMRAPADLYVYQAPDNAIGHIVGRWYYAPRNWDVVKWSFSRPHETSEQARAAADEWCARFDEGGRRGC